MTKRRSLPAFATRFHSRSAPLSKARHEALSEVLIQTLVLCQTALGTVGAELHLEDHKGQPRPVETWARYLRYVMDAPGNQVDAQAALEALSVGEFEGQIQAEVTEYPDVEFPVGGVVAKALELGQEALNVIGVRAWIRYEGEDHPLEAFAERVFNGEVA